MKARYTLMVLFALILLGLSGCDATTKAADLVSPCTSGRCLRR